MGHRRGNGIALRQDLTDTSDEEVDSSEPLGIFCVEFSCAINICVEILRRETGYRFQTVGILHPCRRAAE